MFLQDTEFSTGYYGYSFTKEICSIFFIDKKYVYYNRENINDQINEMKSNLFIIEKVKFDLYYMINVFKN